MKAFNQTILSILFLCMVTLTCIYLESKSPKKSTNIISLTESSISVPITLQNNDTITPYLREAIQVVNDYENLLDKISSNEISARASHKISKEARLDQVLLSGETIISSSMLLADWKSLNKQYDSIIYILDSLQIRSLENIWQKIENRINYLQTKYNMAIADSLYS